MAHEIRVARYGGKEEDVDLPAPSLAQSIVTERGETSGSHAFAPEVAPAAKEQLFRTKVRHQGRDASTAWSEMYLSRVRDVSWTCSGLVVGVRPGRVVDVSWTYRGRVVGAWSAAHREKLEQSMAREGSSS